MQESKTGHGQDTPSLATLVLRLQRYRRLCAYALIASALLLTLAYMVCIWSFFLPHDLRNPRAIQFLTSESFQATTAPMFERLKRYNAASASASASAAGAADLPSDLHDLYASSGSSDGLIVVVYYRLMRAPEMTGAGHAAPARYRYVPHVAIRLDPLYLVGYLVLMIGLCLCLHAVIRKPPDAQRRFEEQVLEHTYSLVVLPPCAGAETGVAALLPLLRRFHVFVQQLGIRHASRPAMAFADEYDVQDALHALLKVHYPYLHPEEYTPSYAGNHSRIDFLLAEEQIAIEVKMTRAGLRDREITNELSIDIVRYSNDPRCRHLVCLIYDPSRLLVNADLLKRDLEDSQAGIGVSVVIIPTA
ncbi:hypothetical protein XcuCFBP2542_07055 [Xanthomonas cucurbitae]|uniref:Uncharacterized protein n=1 Tax=Xanthomonas cucurbitae TaxID=56453 RepID=A0A2S7DTV2_9XANT|nr:hypothetical protein [Xanthomonas cucurbitae]PPU77277.1 hypothetical protein XcuCFBP2542_07055 [Xanthomonas cucurbitae]WDM78704.1 hypothetical protein K6980_16470 [Xanthomonas cucurbitae]WDM82384.1 hypothetical protein K6979_16465 [Xanthomonas cucurbitae]